MGASTSEVKLHFLESGYLLKRLCYILTFQSSTVITPYRNIELSFLFFFDTNEWKSIAKRTQNQARPQTELRRPSLGQNIELSSTCALDKSASVINKWYPHEVSAGKYNMQWCRNLDLPCTTKLCVTRINLKPCLWMTFWPKRQKKYNVSYDRIALSTVSPTWIWVWYFWASKQVALLV